MMDEFISESTHMEFRKRQAREEQYERQRKILLGDYIYSDYCLWCNAFNKGKGKNDAKLFAKFLRQEEIELNFWQRKHLAETHFEYKYKFNHDKNDWEINKVGAEVEE